MSKPIITKQDLINANACTEQVELFEEIFGDSVIVTVSRVKKVANLFDWDWAMCLLDAQGLAEYKRVRAPALAEYRRVIDAARAELDRVEAAAWAEYRRVIAPARAELDRVEAAAWAEYRRVIAPAWATAFINTKEENT